MPRAPGTHGQGERREAYTERERERRRAFDKRRGSSAERGYGAKWRRAREAFLARNPLCVRCLDHDVVAASEAVDHIVPHRGDMRLFWDRKNWQALCITCHNAKTAGEARDTVFMPAGLAPARPALVMVSGAPASGKSHYVGAHAKAGDVVIDLDAILAELTGAQGRAVVWDRELVRAALEERNARLRALAASDAERAWFIVTAARVELRDAWSDALKPRERVVCYAPLSVCKRRIAASPERGPIARQQIAAVERWHAAFTYGAADRVVATG
ncbi:MAG: AAA family ATPase, partial [Dichotomicrobium sp.]